MENATLLVESLHNDPLCRAGDPVRRLDSGAAVGGCGDAVSDRAVWRMLVVLAACMAGAFVAGWVVGAWQA